MNWNDDMHHLIKVAVIVLVTATNVTAQASGHRDLSEQEELDIAALEALMAAPQKRALPIVARVLASDKSDAVKSRALFVLSQIDLPEAQTILLDTVRNGSPELQHEAVRMIGISGQPEALAGLSELYKSGDPQMKESVLQAYLIAGDSAAVYELAVSAADQADFERAVHTLGAMGATEELRQLRGRGGNSEALIQAYSIAGDYDSLRELALDASNPQLQVKAIQSLGVVGGDEVNRTLLQIYRDAERKDVKDAAAQGMMISGFDEGIVELFRDSEDATEKRKLLQMLVAMDSDAAWDIIDATLSEQP